jgi:hypothetical protein
LIHDATCWVLVLGTHEDEKRRYVLLQRHLHGGAGRDDHAKIAGTLKLVVAVAARHVGDFVGAGDVLDTLAVDDYKRSSLLRALRTSGSLHELAHLYYATYQGDRYRKAYYFHCCCC